MDEKFKRQMVEWARMRREFRFSIERLLKKSCGRKITVQRHGGLCQVGTLTKIGSQEFQVKGVSWVLEKFFVHEIVDILECRSEDKEQMGNFTIFTW